MTNLLVRILTALGFGTLFLLAIFLSPYSLGAIFLVINGIAIYEYFNIKSKIIKSDSEPIGYLTFFAVFFYIFFLLALHINDLFLIGSAVSLIIPLFIKKKLKLFTFLKGILYITIPCILVNVIVLWGDFSDFNPFLIFGILLLVWSNDIFAYFIGKYLGKRKLAPNISPNKTVEGFIGGFAGSLLAGFALSILGNDNINFHWIILAIIVGITGPIGDLIESKLKRRAEIKDSGKILPGHGGLLDRMDAFFFASYFVFVYLYLFVS